MVNLKLKKYLYIIVIELNIYLWIIVRSIIEVLVLFIVLKCNIDILFVMNFWWKIKDDRRNIYCVFIVDIFLVERGKLEGEKIKSLC